MQGFEETEACCSKPVTEQLTKVHLQSRKGVYSLIQQLYFGRFFLRFGGLIWQIQKGVMEGKPQKVWIYRGTSLAVQWLRLCASTAGGAGSIPGQGTTIPHAAWCGQKTPQKTKNILIKNVY